MHWKTLRREGTGARNCKEILFEQKKKSKTSCPPIN